MGGRSGADAICLSDLDNESISLFNNSCNSVRAVLSVDSNDEIRDMATNYSIPTNRTLRSISGVKFADSWDNLTANGVDGRYSTRALGNAPEYHWTGTATGAGDVSNYTCSNWTSSSGSLNGRGGSLAMSNTTDAFLDKLFSAEDAWCGVKWSMMCICY